MGVDGPREILQQVVVGCTPSKVASSARPREGKSDSRSTKCGSGSDESMPCEDSRPTRREGAVAAELYQKIESLHGTGCPALSFSSRRRSAISRTSRCGRCGSCERRRSSPPRTPGGQPASLPIIEIDTPTTSLHGTTNRDRAPLLLRTCSRSGEDIALVTDAGTPLVSDPGQDSGAGGRPAASASRRFPGPAAS